jgi:mono/diheme cytochrome c family protein
MRQRIAFLLMWLTVAPRLPSQPPADRAVSFYNDIQPLLIKNCQSCHSGTGAEAGLHLDSPEGVLNGSESQKVVIAGDSKRSVLVQRISDKSGNGMPPPGPISDEDIALIVAWIDQGAKVDSRPAIVNLPKNSTGRSSPERVLLDRYCVTCHNQNLKTANLLLDKLDLSRVRENAQVLEKVVRMVRAGMMPPAGASRLDPTTREALVSSLEDKLDQNAVANLPPPGLHRLNRNEYSNAIRDLLGLNVDAATFLPSDDSTHGFDNIAGALTLSPALLEAYMSAAGKISRLAIGDVTASAQAVYLVPEDATQDYHVEGLPFGTRGGMLIRHEFPADGTYRIKVTSVKRGNMGGGRAFGDVAGEQLEVLVDGERVGLFNWDKEVSRPAAYSYEPGAVELRIRAGAGSHAVGVTFLATNYAPTNDHNKHFLRTTIETGGIPGFTFFPHVASVRITGPFDGKTPSDTPTRRKIFVCKPASADDEAACAKKIAATLASRAFRRSVSDRDIEMLMRFYQQGRSNGTFDQGIEMVVQRIIADPEFIFRKEREPTDVSPGTFYHISDLELASRLSFFLWSSIPDEELLGVASRGELKDSAVLVRQARRMLADPRSEAMILNFAGQWLDLRGLQSATPVTMVFPDFDDNLRQALRRETELFFASIVREDRSVLDLLTANYTFVNERLARHYGIPNIYGSRFRRVTLGEEFDMRRGLLGKGALLMVSSQPGRTSPVQRGKWFLQTFLGVSPPDRPPNVPDLTPTAEKVLGSVTIQPSMRHQMEDHRANPACAACHKIMDPIGFSLENFDAIGAWRTLDGGSPIDPSGELVDGTRLNGPASLRQALVRYSDQYVRVVTEKLLTYALGRGVEYYDMPVVRSIVRNAARDNYRFSSFVIGVITSEPFRTNMKLQENGQSAAR